MARFSLNPREPRYFDLFVASSHNAVIIANTLVRMLENWHDAVRIMSEIEELEQKGDDITHEVMSLLNRSYITPFDREDITKLAHTLDDISDFIHAAADAMTIYRIESPTKRSRELAQILVEATREVNRAMELLKSGTQPKKLLAYCVDLNRLENDADLVSRAALGELFQEHSDEASIIKWREIYQHMESATDRCEDVADVLEGIAIKNG